MMEIFAFIREHFFTLLPVLLFEAILIGYCVIKILREGVANLSKGLWLLIVVAGNLVGSILFLIYGRRSDVD